MRIPLLGGAYTAQSLIANAQRCVNLYPEQNPGDSPVQATHYPTPGLTIITRNGDSPEVPDIGPGRGLYWASNNQLYGVIGLTLYLIDSNWQYTLLGMLDDDLTTPVSMIDNGNYLVVVDGPSGYTVELATNTFAKIVDVNFLGADRTDYIDTFVTFNRPRTRQFYCTLSNVLTLDPLYFASKAGSPDNLSTQIVTHREIWLLGEQYSTEVWVNAGNPNFPFVAQPGAYIQYGCAAKYSVYLNGLSIYWLGQDRNGNRFVLEGKGYSARIISTPAISQELSQYPTVNDAVGFCYQQNGHVFYVLNFPNANKTWVFDATTELWHERSYMDDQGRENRIRPICHAYAYGRNCCLDWQNGNLYYFDLKNYTDDGQPIVRRRSFPHLVEDGKRVNYKSFEADIETGTQITDDPNEVMVSLRWSDTRGYSWGNPVMQPMGLTGQYGRFPIWRRLGIARDRVFELFWSAPGQYALNGGFVDPEVAET